MVEGDINNSVKEGWSVKVFQLERYHITVRLSKILGNLLIERIRKALEKELRKEQAGIRKGKGTSDQIFILRNIIEQSVEWQALLYLNFIDFEKAFDSKHRETLWKIMEFYGVPSKIATIIKKLYQSNEICATNHGLQSDWVRIKRGVTQGCGMSGFLFLLVLDWVMRNSVQGKNTGIRWNFMSKLEDLDFADDIAIIWWYLGRNNSCKRMGREGRTEN